MIYLGKKMDDEEKNAKIKECYENIVSLVKELAAAWAEIKSTPSLVAPTTDEGIRHRMEIGGRLLTLRTHLENKLKILEQVEAAPNIIDKWEGNKNDESA